MKEQNRLRLERMSTRYEARQKEKAESDEERFVRAFGEARDRIIRPLMEEVAEELRRAGHSPEITIDEAAEKPSIELCLGLRAASKKRGSNVVGFYVIRWESFPEVLSYLVVKPPPMDLMRFASPEEISRDYVEQMLVDAVEHIFACNSI